MSLLNHFKKYSNSNLELFDMVPDLPTVYADVNSSPDTSKCFSASNESISPEDMSETDSLDDLINMNTNNNNNSHMSRDSNNNSSSSSSSSNISSNIINDLDKQAKPNQDNEPSQPNEILNFNAIKWHINTVCLRMFTYFLFFVQFLQQQLEQLNQCARISLVKK